jgi:hypothetical protein
MQISPAVLKKFNITSQKRNRHIKIYGAEILLQKTVFIKPLKQKKKKKIFAFDVKEISFSFKVFKIKCGRFC